MPVREPVRLGYVMESTVTHSRQATCQRMVGLKRRVVALKRKVVALNQGLCNHKLSVSAGPDQTTGSWRVFACVCG